MILVALLCDGKMSYENGIKVWVGLSKKSIGVYTKEFRKLALYFLNPEDVSGLYEMLEEGLRVRIAKEDTIIPNIELKFVKDDFDNYAIDNRLEVVLGEKHLFISPIELQIPYKLYLGGDKDIEDAMYLLGHF